MDHSQQAPDYYSGFQDTQFPANRPPNAVRGAPYPPDGEAPTQPEHATHPWGWECNSSRYNFPAPPAAGGLFPGPHLTPPFVFDPSVPPPPFSCPPQGLYPPTLLPAPCNNPSSSRPQTAPFQTANPFFRPARYDLDAAQREPLPQRGTVLDQRGGASGGTSAEEGLSLQALQDRRWVRSFLQSRGKTCRSPQSPQQRPCSAVHLRRTASVARELLSRLGETCTSLRSSMEEDSWWSSCYSEALQLKQELQEVLSVLSDSQSRSFWEEEVTRRRNRRSTASRRLQLEEQQREERRAEKEAKIDRWMLHQIQQVEEKKKEQELKRTADGVLCEVRRKQADVRRMMDVLRSLEKLRKLRKEAASRKGILMEAQCDAVFLQQVEQLRAVLRRRTGVYGVEEQALLVMLEGEQEEQRRREEERLLKKERERQLQRRRSVHAALFGEAPADSVLDSFSCFYSQAEESLHALLHVRSQWDAFLVSADHPDGSAVPQGWVLPDPPSGGAWTSALQTSLNSDL